MASTTPGGGTEDDDGGGGDFLKGRKCEFCGSPAARVNFARILCDSEECVNRAFDERGGPGGHKLLKKQR